MPEPLPYFALWLTDAMAKAGVTDADVAQAAGVTPAAVLQWRRGNGKPRDDVRRSVAAALRVDFVTLSVAAAGGPE